MMNININETKPGKVQISPIEDLMREHGVLHRILLIYRDIISRCIGEKPYVPFIIYPALLNSTNIAKKFIEEYHQVLEEQYIFPKFSQKSSIRTVNTTTIKTALCSTVPIHEDITTYKPTVCKLQSAMLSISAVTIIIHSYV